ncbi:SPW repeat protein [bacterium]|nr:SPW repeat protein [bacterium]
MDTKDMNTPKKVLDGINFILGLWLIIAPWALKTTLNPVSTWTAVIIGICVVIVSAWGMAQTFSKMSEWLNVILGALFFISPWVLGFASISAAWNAWILGAAIVILALIATVTMGRYVTR